MSLFGMYVLVYYEVFEEPFCRREKIFALVGQGIIESIKHCNSA